MEGKTSLLEFKEKVRQDYPDEDWILAVAMMLGIQDSGQFDFHIYRVPERIRKVNEDHYNPRMVSVGPFHHGRPNLADMEERKWSYMLYLLRRTSDPKLCLHNCGSAISDLDEKVRSSYAESLRWNPRELAEIMLVDACFIIELFIRSFLRDVSDVPAFNNVWMVPALRHDLLLIENQIPYVVLEHLYIIIKPLLKDGSREFPELTDLALHFFYPDFSFNGEPNRGNFRHLLDLLRKFNLPKVSSESVPQNLEEEFIPIRQIKQIWGFKYSTTKLLEAGIQFEMDSKQKLTDITFSHGTLKIPPLRIGETTNSLLRNLIAYEQCGLNISQEFTSYVRLLNSLVCSWQDVELLQQKGIITHDLVAEEIVALFESLLQEVVLKDFSYGGLCNEVNAYHLPWWNPCRVKAALNRDYFPNPWRTIQFVFVVVIQLLVVAQTVYAVLAYHT